MGKAEIGATAKLGILIMTDPLVQEWQKQAQVKLWCLQPKCFSRCSTLKESEDQFQVCGGALPWSRFYETLITNDLFLFQQCCDCCNLGLRLRSEGKTCESNINLGYPCSHVMLSCCEGGDHFIHPEIKKHPEPSPTATPEKSKCPFLIWRRCKCRLHLMLPLGEVLQIVML